MKSRSYSRWQRLKGSSRIRRHNLTRKATRTSIRPIGRLLNLLKMLSLLWSCRISKKQGSISCMAHLRDRQKLILLADKSPFGWKVVLEYKHHNLADDKEDEKIYRQESRAARAVKRSSTRPVHQRRVSPATHTRHWRAYRDRYVTHYFVILCM